MDEWGEDEIRLKIAQRLFGTDSEKLSLAQEWLRRKSQDRVDEAERLQRESSLESNQIARSAKNAAWAAAIAAIIAAICAVIAVFLST
jgi:hypothetical protein